MFIDPKFYNVSTNNWYAVVVFFFAATPNEPNSVNFMLLVLYQTTERTEKNITWINLLYTCDFSPTTPKNYSSFHISFRNFTILLFYISSLSPAHAHSVDCIVCRLDVYTMSDGLQSLFLSESLTLFFHLYATNQAGKQAQNTMRWWCVVGGLE